MVEQQLIFQALFAEAVGVGVGVVQHPVIFEAIVAQGVRVQRVKYHLIFEGRMEPVEHHSIFEEVMVEEVEVEEVIENH